MSIEEDLVGKNRSGSGMNKELKAFSLLLMYPEKNVISALDEIGVVLEQSQKISDEDKKNLKGFLNYLAGKSLADIQETYVETFEVGRAASLNLFEHFLGDSRDRGASMTSLVRMYEDHGLKLETNELPDYLPVLLDFLSGLPWEDAVTWIHSAAPHITKIDIELQKRESPWRAITSTLLHIGKTATKEAMPTREDLLPTIEADWFDAPVTFATSQDPVKQGIHFVKGQAASQK